MKLLTAYKFHTDVSWGSFSDAPIYLKDDTIYYPYRVSQTLHCTRITIDGTAKTRSVPIPEDKCACLPGLWRIFEYEGHVILSCGNPQPPTNYFPNRFVCSLFVDLDDGMKAIDLPPEITAARLCQPPLDESAEVTLSDCVMRYKNSRRYQCFDRNGNLLWEEKHKGYRYTPFEERDGCVIFGSAGHGGGLYCYRKQTGETLCAVDTGGTSRYVWCNGSIVSRGRGGELLLIDPFTGKIRESILPDCPMTDCSSFHAEGSRLCAVGFEKNTNSPCVYLFDAQAV